MRTNFDELRTIAYDFAAKMEDTLADMLSVANAQRRELIDLYGRMNATRGDLLEFAEITDELAMVFDGVTDAATDVSYKIETAMCDGGNFVPECNYEDLVDFCDECGRAITSDEEYTEEAGGFVLCADCRPIDEDDELDEETDDNQLSIDLAETVEA